MTTMTQLFKLIITNDYEQLEKIIINNKKADINCVKSGYSLISKAIEVRAKECFDILLSSPNLEIIHSKSDSLSGLKQALDYFLKAPNASNEYYLQSLLDKKIYISSYNIRDCIEHPHIFNTMFNLIDKSDYLIHTEILIQAIQNNNMKIFIQIFEFINQNNLEFARSTIFTSKLMYDAIINNNINVINYLVQNNVEWKIIQNSPSIYSVLSLTNYNIHIFNYFYSLYEKLSEKDINQIPGIDNITIELPKFYNLDTIRNTNANSATNNNINYTLIEVFEKLYKLPIKYNSTNNIINNYILNVWNSYKYWNKYSKQSVKSDNSNILTIYWLLKNNNITIDNPYTQLTIINQEKNNIIDKAKNYSPSYNKLYIDFINLIKSYILKIIYVFDHFNWKIPDNLVTTFNELFINENPETFKSNQTKFINELEDLLKNPTKNVKKGKKQKDKNIIV